MKDKVIFILDASNSMDKMGNEPVQCMNLFCKEQHQHGQFVFKLALFNYKTTIIYDNIDSDNLVEFKKEDYKPEGMTALYDAIGTVIEDEKKDLTSYKKTFLIILTDGLENCSKTYKKDQIKEMILDKETNFGWTTTYLGANQDAFAVGNELGMTNSINYEYSPEGFSDVIRTVSNNISSYRYDSEIKEA